jgi:hypothetical protein
VFLELGTICEQQADEPNRDLVVFLELIYGFLGIGGTSAEQAPE